jgi:hypothetical protein
MTHFDVFNGDADGLCALHQLRLADPRDAMLVTGVKRDIALLGRISANVAANPVAGDSVTVLDVSIDANRAPLLTLLARGVSVLYFDHHSASEVPAHPMLRAVIDNTPDVCTGILVDRWLAGAHRPWAVVAAFGDNLAHAAHTLAASLPLRPPQRDALQALGECLNYNAYGDSEADLIMPPAALYAVLHRHADPFTFIDTEPIFPLLHDARKTDLETARQTQPYACLPQGDVVLLPDAAWSRRVRGAYGNLLAIGDPTHAHAVLTPDGKNGYTASVRAPLAHMQGADRLCRLFSGGGGRPAAAGINHLPQERLPAFIAAFEQAFDNHAGNA